MLKVQKKEGLVTPIYVRITSRLKKRLDGLHAKTGVPIAEIIRQVLEKELFDEEGILYTRLESLTRRHRKVPETVKEKDEKDDGGMKIDIPA